MWWHRRRGTVVCRTASGRHARVSALPIPGRGVALVDPDGRVVAVFDLFAASALRGEIREAAFAAFGEPPPSSAW